MEITSVSRAAPPYLQSGGGKGHAPSAGSKRPRPEPANGAFGLPWAQPARGPARAPATPAPRAAAAGGRGAPAPPLSEAEERARRELPVCAGRAEILRELELSDSLVVMAETGSGKTTQIPQFLYEAG